MYGALLFGERLTHVMEWGVQVHQSIGHSDAGAAAAAACVSCSWLHDAAASGPTRTRMRRVQSSHTLPLFDVCTATVVCCFFVFSSIACISTTAIVARPQRPYEKMPDGREEQYASRRRVVVVIVAAVLFRVINLRFCERFACRRGY